ncbi:protein kinase [Cytophagaceae bacterium DM2B3-1]|uniref:Protein kinase n=1 Tax=Xanthocytophaga flava TaxID=3048013 RepID=A0ABT7CLV2_9BACT|nr:protein kinase [Xanthocytophaga flavus]MDJ1467629.1 protein kinase [Xanthocytophaga flavus]MDJ1494717.1 protein kinase [Xanthocytophaga flavus]
MAGINEHTNDDSPKEQSQFVTSDNSTPPSETNSKSDDGSGFIISDNPVNESDSGTFTTPPADDNASTFISSESSDKASQTTAPNSTNANWSGIRFTSTFTDIMPLAQQGAMSLTQKARLDGRWVVVKRLLPEHRTNPTYIELFFKEYFNGRDLQHEHIVNIYGRGEDQEGPFFYMEYVDGQPLSHRIPEGGISDERFVRKVATEMLQALSYAHKKQVYHRDLKPDNILITNRGDNVKIIDFGLAAADTFDDIKNATFIGTKTYAAPEQTLTGSSVDGRADLYAFGIILLEMFTGIPSRDKISVVKHNLWRTIIQKCTQLEPEQRYHNADEVLDLIEANTSQLFKAPTEDKLVSKEIIESNALQKKEEELRRKEQELQQREQKIKQQSKPQQVSTPVYINPVPPKQTNYGWVWWIVGLAALAGVSYAAQEQEDRFLKVILSLISFGIIILLFVGVIRWWQRLNIGWKVILLGVLAGGIYFYYKQQQKEKDAIESRLTNESNLKSVIEDYYHDLEQHNFTAVETYFAPTIEKYFNRNDVKVEELQPILTNFWEKTPEDMNVIDWSTFKHEVNTDDEYVKVSFYMNYHFRRRTSSTMKMVRAKTVIKFDKDLKIFYIAGN